MKTKYCYAVEWPCGIANHANTGRPFRIVYRFESAADRSKWIDNGGDFRTGPRFREAVTRREVEGEIRHAETLNPCGDPWMRYGDEPQAEACI